ncbi:hypothetical protein GXW78_07175 [Roseomonas terrae]|uniref:Uncharacterized protein n=1 Tax=Neoroseomonas terrae TaxID=424799 RepID=A0ABS5EEJ5_9PROT|nr:hypothetical protein [Neoroseomonas terrae]MBR0649439.1 hypothetical protein [Neoroseomonas terrae]
MTPRHRPTTLPRARNGAAAALAASLVLVVPSEGLGQAPAAGAAARPAAAVDARLRRIEDGLGALDERLRRAEEPRSGPTAGVRERLVSALLHLETVIGNGRPWPREWQLILSLDGAELLPPLYLEVLGSHAARGLPSLRDLQDRFEAVAPAIAARATSDEEFLERTVNVVRSAFAGIGLVAPAEPSAVDTVLASIRDHLRRGELPGALTEVATLAEDQQALLAGWIAQMRARVAVEQSLQEAILGLLSTRARQG